MQSGCDWGDVAWGLGWGAKRRRSASQHGVTAGRRGKGVGIAGKVDVHGDAGSRQPVADPLLFERTPAAEARALADAVERIGGAEVVPKHSGTAKQSRYLHATLRVPALPGRYRLKVVNPTHPDAGAIRRCCRNANRVHGGLERLKRTLGFRVPQWCPAPEGLESNMYVVEEVDDTAPSLDRTGGLAEVVDGLVDLEMATRDFDAPQGTKPPWIESCNRAGYRERVEFSLQGLRDRREIAARELDAVVARFDEHWSADRPFDTGRCFSHGDFSCGNVRAAEELWLIDFEHAHVGVPVLDMAHLFVNLMFDDRTETARQLRSQYEALRVRRGMSALDGVFAALVLERAAGKWNAMKVPTPERRARIRRLLLQASE